MALFGKQHRYCPNCGKRLYDTNTGLNAVMPLMCSKECREEYQLKYARSILGQDTPIQ